MEWGGGGWARGGKDMVITNKISGFGQLKSWPSFSIQAINLSNFFRNAWSQTE